MIKSFVKDERGGVMILFALTAATLIGLGGAAVDYSRASAVRAGMQAAVDAAAIAALQAGNVKEAEEKVSGDMSSEP